MKTGHGGVSEKDKAKGSGRDAETKTLPSRIPAQGSFRWQIIMVFVVGFFILIAAFTAYQVRTESAYLYRDSTDETTSLAESLAASSRSWVLANDVAGLQEVVHSLQGHTGLHYAMVASPSGRVLAHSDATKVGQFVSDEQSLSLINAPPHNRIMIDDASRIDIAVPILIENRLIGWARVAQGREEINGYLHNMMLSSTLFVLMALALSLFAALLIANRLGYRIGYLMRVAEAVQAGNYATRANISGADEIARLSNSLNHMLDVLAQEEELLRRSEHSLAEAQRIAHLGNWNLDLVNNVLTWSDEIYRIFEIDPEKFGASYEAFLDAIHPDDRKMANNAYTESVKDKMAYDIEHRLLMKDGRVKYVNEKCETYYSEDGQPLRSVGTVHDITEHKKTETELRELNKDFVTLLENTGDFIYFKDKDSRIRFCSQTLANITGHPSWRDMIGKHDQEIFPKDTARIYYEEELPIFREGKTLLNKTDPYYDEMGRPGWVSTNKWPVFGDDKKTVVGIFGISRDITELKEAEDKINELNSDLERRVTERTAQLEDANKELEAFSYSVSHDLRTPLRAIDGFSRILLDDYSDKLDDEGKRLLNVVRDNTSRMGQLIDDILKFSRTGRLELNFSEIDMQGLSREVVEELQPANGKLQVEIEPIPQATGDRAMMHQVFVNLLSNAIKFSRTREVANIKVGGSIEGDEAVYYVKDNGVGFDMQYANKLFGVFQRLHAMSEFEGTGIGLAIVKRIVTRHGGRVWAEGRVNEGATIFFALPTKEMGHG